MSMSTRHKHTLKGRFVLRADSICPYSLGGEAAAIHRTTQLRAFQEAKSLPYMASALCNSFRGAWALRTVFWCYPSISCSLLWQVKRITCFSSAIS